MNVTELNKDYALAHLEILCKFSQDKIGIHYSHQNKVYKCQFEVLECRILPGDLQQHKQQI